MFFIQVQKASSVKPLEYRLVAFTCSELKRALPTGSFSAPVPTEVYCGNGMRACATVFRE